MRKCTTCHQSADVLKTVIMRGRLYEGCEHCIYNLMQGTATAASNKRSAMQRTYAQDIVQPSQTREFIKARGIEKSREFYSDEQIRKYS